MLLSVTLLNVFFVGNANAKIPQSLPSIDVNSFEGYTNNPSTNVDTRVYIWYGAVPHPTCVIKPVSDPEGERKCTPQTE